MAYDESFVSRVRDALAGEDGISEKRMFGGLAFMVDGRLAVSASGRGGLLVRADPREVDALLDEPGVSRFRMRGRPTTGWLQVEDDALVEDAALQRWVARGVGYARTL